MGFGIHPATKLTPSQIRIVPTKNAANIATFVQNGM